MIMKKEETFYGEKMLATSGGPDGVGAMKLVEQQTLSMRLYESRIASLQRAVAFFVMFHQMGKDVQVESVLDYAVVCISARNFCH